MHTHTHDSSEPLAHGPRNDIADYPQSASPEYPRYTTISHNRSASDSTVSTAGSNPRSASPATSISSVASYHPAGPAFSNDVNASNQYVDGSTAVPIISRPKHQKKRLVGPQRREICLYQQEHPGAKQEEIANHFGVERSTVSKILKYKDKWLAVPSEEAKGMSVAKHRSVFYSLFSILVLISAFEAFEISVARNAHSTIHHRGDAQRRAPHRP